MAGPTARTGLPSPISRSSSLSSSTLEDATKLWDALAAGATVLEPLAASGWSAGFGMLTDAFRVTWVLDVQDASSHV